MNKTFVLRDNQSANDLWKFLKQWRDLAQCGKPISVVVSEHKVKRSTDQNARYWKILSQIAEQVEVSGKRYLPELWAEYFKEIYIGMEETPSKRYVTISTTTLSVGDFGDYMNKIEAYAVSDLNVVFEGI